MLEVIERLNWVDLIVIIILLRIGYVAMKSGFSVEIFKLQGTVVAIYISLHYYTAFSDWLVKSANISISKGKMPLEFMDFICFVILVITGYIIFVGLRIALYRLIKMEAVPQLNKWGGLVLGIVRGYLLAGLIIFMLVISTLSYLRNSAINSYLARYLFKVAPATYTWLWDNITSKFMSSEKFNKTILEISQDLKL